MKVEGGLLCLARFRSENRMEVVSTIAVSKWLHNGNALASQHM